MATDPKVTNSIHGQRLMVEGAQLGMFEADGSVIPAEKRSGPGRPPGATNKLKSRLRDYLAAQGYRDPAEHLALLAGLDRRDKHPLHVAAEIAAIIGEDTMSVAREMRQAAEALLPYWHAKLTPDVSITTPAANILMVGTGGMVAMSVPGTDDPFAPLDVRLAMLDQGEQNQGLSDVIDADPDGGSRTP